VGRNLEADVYVVLSVLSRESIAVVSSGGHRPIRIAVSTMAYLFERRKTNSNCDFLHGRPHREKY
jgi:hypothetical protein